MSHKFCRILRQTLTCSIPSSQLFSPFRSRCDAVAAVGVIKERKSKTFTFRAPNRESGKEFPPPRVLFMAARFDDRRQRSLANVNSYAWWNDLEKRRVPSIFRLFPSLSLSPSAASSLIDFQGRAENECRERRQGKGKKIMYGVYWEKRENQ